MSVSRGVTTFIDNFDRAQAFTTTPGQNGWTVDVEGGGTPTHLCTTENGGGLTITLDNTSEAQGVTLYHNDVLQYDVRHLKTVWWIAQVTNNNVTDLNCGVASARNDTPDSVATNAWFDMDGSESTTIVNCQTDDGGGNDLTADSGDTLAAVYKKMLIDFTNGLADVRFFMDGARVASGTTFDMSDLSAGLNVQPYFQYRKTTGTTVPSCKIAQFGITYEWAYGV